MRISRRTFVLLAFLAVVIVAALGWIAERGRARKPYAAPEAALSGWTLVTSDGTDPWVVGAQPPDALTRSLFEEVSRRTGRTLVAPPHRALALVLRSEFDEGLQGVYGTDSVLRIASEAGIESARFQPVCLGHRTSTGQGGRSDLYFVAFDSPAFNQMRVDLLPAQPEHAGVGVYEPATLTPILIVGASDNVFDRWWPLTFDPARDCEADLALPETHN